MSHIHIRKSLSSHPIPSATLTPDSFKMYLNCTVCWARICKPFKEPRNWFPAWRACATTPFCRTGPPGYIGWRNWFLGIDSYRLLQRLQIRALGMKILYTPPQSINFVSKHFSYYDLKECLGCGVPGAVGINQADPSPSYIYTDSLKHLSSSHLSPFSRPPPHFLHISFPFLICPNPISYFMVIFLFNKYKSCSNNDTKNVHLELLFCAVKTLFFNPFAGYVQ